MPLELSLILVAIVGSHGMNPEGESVNYLIDNLNSIRLIVSRVNLQDPDPCDIVYGRILETPNRFAV